MSASQQIVSVIIETKPIKWRELQFLQNDSLKDLSEKERAKLKVSLMSNNFADPFKVWKDPMTGTEYCLEGKHRTDLLQEIATEGIMVPDLLPATFIRCKNKKVAAALVLVYSSMFAKMNTEGLYDYLQEFNLDTEQIRQYINLPEIDIDKLLEIPDLSSHNLELEIEPMGDTMNMVFEFNREDFTFVNAKLHDIMKEFGVESKEVALIRMIKRYD